jgi:hypothetical protein
MPLGLFLYFLCKRRTLWLMRNFFNDGILDWVSLDSRLIFSCRRRENLVNCLLLLTLWIGISKGRLEGLNLLTDNVLESVLF